MPKFLRYRGAADTDAPYFCIGVDDGNGKVQRLLQTTSADQDADQASRRAVDALNACEGLSDRTLSAMAAGGTKFGDLAERTMIVSLLAAFVPRVYERMQKHAREAIRKDGGKV